MEKLRRNLTQKGITLVALVVTIVVLLVLAGITINLLFNDNGIIKRAQDAKNAWKNGDAKEQEGIQNLKDVLNHYTNGTGGNTGGSSLPSDGSYSEAKGVNTPKLGEGMTPITWNGTEWVEPKTEDEWYDYSSTAKKWANAKTVDGSMWVWIPRYAYQIESGWHQSGADINEENGNNSAGKINIKFLQGTSNTASDGTTSWDNASGLNNWNVHPAFSYGNEVNGIWVAKFEASRSDASNNGIGSSDTIKIQPTVQSWTNINISNMYSNCLNYNSTLNSHQMKNSEWGACVYLAQSSYGKNSEVWINNYGICITGSAGNSVSAEQNTGITNDYTSSQGVNASTTGNIYGIYDMSGGAWEYVAAYVNNGHENLQHYGANLVNGNAKTKDVYVSSTSSGSNTEKTDYEMAKAKYGDAIYETSSTYSRANASWYGDYACFPYSDFSFFVRGGNYRLSSAAGLFCFNYYQGDAYSGYGFRPVLIVL